jgi:hypothetical protein
MRATQSAFVCIGISASGELGLLPARQTLATLELAGSLQPAGGGWEGVLVAARPHTEKAALVLARSGPDHASLARYHSTVRRSADANVSCGFQPSSSRILLASMA